jgi:hypothetical protein
MEAKMARNTEETAPADSANAAAPVEGAATTTSSANTGRGAISFKLDAQGATDLAGKLKPNGQPYVEGDDVRRKEYIMARISPDFKNRGAIAKELTRLEGRPVAYQIVFQATGKGPASAAPSAPAATPVVAPASVEAAPAEAPTS